MLCMFLCCAYHKYVHVEFCAQDVHEKICVRVIGIQYLYDNNVTCTCSGNTTQYIVYILTKMHQRRIDQHYLTRPHHSVVYFL